MPNAPLHSTSTRPPEGIREPRCLGDLWAAERKAKAEHECKSFAAKAAPTEAPRLTTHLTYDAKRPISRPSRMNAARGVKGQGRPLYAAPWSNDGMREVRSFPRSAWERSKTKHRGQGRSHGGCGSALDYRPTNLTDDAKRPISRLNGIVAQGVERHGCRESSDGPGMALRGEPLEQDGVREVERSETRMQGARPFGYFWGVCQK
jgi:hypothetical protein